MRFFHFLTLAGSLVGGLILFDMLLSSGASAPQQGAAAAIAVAFAVIPYCLARSLQLMGTDNSVRDQLKRSNELLEQITKNTDELTMPPVDVPPAGRNPMFR